MTLVSTVDFTEPRENRASDTRSQRDVSNGKNRVVHLDPFISSKLFSCSARAHRNEWHVEKISGIETTAKGKSFDAVDAETMLSKTSNPC